MIVEFCFLAKFFKFYFCYYERKNFIVFLRKKNFFTKKKKKTIYEKGLTTSIPVAYASGHFEVKINK